MTEDSKLKKFDSSMYDVIVFDEICLVDLTFYLESEIFVVPIQIKL